MRNTRHFFIFIIILLLSILFRSFVPAAGQAPEQSENQQRSEPVLELEPVNDNWAEWRPVWEINESFTATLDTGSDATDALTSTTFIFTLEDTSRYPGYCMNAGDKDDRNFDIIFREADQSNDSNFTYTVSEDGQTLTVNCTNPATTFTVVVFVRDYGAHSIANTIATYVFYDSTTTLKERQELMNYAKKSIRNEANVRGWNWLKLEEHYQELK